MYLTLLTQYLYLLFDHIQMDITPEYPMHPTVLGLGLGLEVWLGLGIRVRD